MDTFLFCDLLRCIAGYEMDTFPSNRFITDVALMKTITFINRPVHCRIAYQEITRYDNTRHQNSSLIDRPPEEDPRAGNESVLDKTEF